MTLHDTTNHQTIYRWFIAQVTVRYGRKHILRVPYITLDPERVLIPNWYRNYYPDGETRYRNDIRRNRHLIPSRFPDGWGERVCDTEQTARRWNHWGLRYGYGPLDKFCAACITWETTHPNSGTERQDTITNEIRHNAANFEDWQTAVENRYYITGEP